MYNIFILKRHVVIGVFMFRVVGNKATHDTTCSVHAPLYIFTTLYILYRIGNMHLSENE